MKTASGRLQRHLPASLSRSFTHLHRPSDAGAHAVQKGEGRARTRELSKVSAWLPTATLLPRFARAAPLLERETIARGAPPPSRRTDGRRRASPGRESRARRPRSVRHECGRTAPGHQGTTDPRPGRGIVGTVSRRARPLREASSRGQTRCTRTRPADRRTLILKLPLPLIPVARQAPSRFTNPCDEKLLRAGPSTRISQVADLDR